MSLLYRPKVIHSSEAREQIFIYCVPQAQREQGWGMSSSGLDGPPRPLADVGWGCLSRTHPPQVKEFTDVCEEVEKRDYQARSF